jgi:hypothetical protein
VDTEQTYISIPEGGTMVYTLGLPSWKLVHPDHSLAEMTTHPYGMLDTERQTFSTDLRRPQAPRCASVGRLAVSVSLSIPPRLLGQTTARGDALQGKQHLRIKCFYGVSANGVKTQIWIAISTYVLVAILKKRLGIEHSLYTILQILSVSAFERIELSQPFSSTIRTAAEKSSSNQLQLLDFERKLLARVCKPFTGNDR